MKATFYTSLCGDIDPPRTDIPCFSDYDLFKDPRRNSRFAKILPHLVLPEYKWTVYVDANVFPKQPVEAFVELADGHDITVFSHKQRDCIYEEAEECKRLNKDDHDLIDAQVAHYRELGYPEHGGLYNCCVIIRRKNIGTCWRNEMWWGQYCRWTCRDQLSFPIAFWDHVHRLPRFPSWDNDWFKLESHKKP